MAETKYITLDIQEKSGKKGHAEYNATNTRCPGWGRSLTQKMMLVKDGEAELETNFPLWLVKIFWKKTDVTITVHTVHELNH